MEFKIQSGATRDWYCRIANCSIALLALLRYSTASTQRTGGAPGDSPRESGQRLTAKQGFDRELVVKKKKK